MTGDVTSIDDKVVDRISTDTDEPQVTDFEGDLVRRIKEKTKLRAAHLEKQRAHEMAAYVLLGGINALKEALTVHTEHAAGKTDADK